MEGVPLPYVKRRQYWTLLVWIIIGLFVFPLTPPISQHFPADVEILVESNTNQVLTHQEPVPSLEMIRAHKNLIHWHDDYHREYFITVFVVFILFILSKVREQLKGALLAFLKFTSLYVGIIHSSYQASIK
ncbi:hypothetical protein GK047_11615 [Paenibacillus sp. SYP-B3998]|uniref:Uncharacterized protein n=1 Tax=Paenibacillus sp. SYP-B3998 TaxID=2678564 RepID=A0A6G3ZX02_9BACL|nr:hypothetical protein [Paenibacillus sp. SYP-B3998]NEW06662.1 hypothetical protein [Paenibacillus sp. SYP-B3998]